MNTNTKNTKNMNTMNSETMKEFERTLGAANVRLYEIIGDKRPLEDVVLTYADGTLRSGTREIARIDLTQPDGLKMAKKAIWCMVDAQKEANPRSKAKKTEKPEAAPDAKKSDGPMKAIEAIVASANKELQKIVEGGFPFVFDEVRMEAKFDSAGVYVHSGTTPVCVVARVGSSEAAVREIREKVGECVEATRVAVERRGGLKAEADALEDEGRKLDAARAALEAAGQDVSMLSGVVPRDVVAAVVKAVKEAVAAANRNPFVGLVKVKKYRLSVKVNSAGVVVCAGGQPCIVSRFPKVANNRVIEKMTSYVAADVAALAESSRAYFEKVRREADREERLREIAAKLDEAERLVASM
jgi:hypothetical protein